MTAWTPRELAVVTDSGTPNLSAGDDGQPGVDIGMVAVGGELYVRAPTGEPSPAGTGQRVNTVARNVLLQIPAEIEPADAIDAAPPARSNSPHPVGVLHRPARSR